MSDPEAGRYCGGTGVPPAIEGDPDGVLWTRYICDDGACGGHWSPRAIRRRTERFVYADPSPGELGERTVRLDRAKLEGEGSVWSRGHSSTFYTADEMRRIVAEGRKDRLEGRHRAAMVDLESGRRRMELGGRLDFHEVAPGILKMDDTHIYAHDNREEGCPRCGGKGKVGRSKCRGCFGRGQRQAMDNYDQTHKIPRPSGSYCTTTAIDLDHLREMFLRGSIGWGGEPAFVLTNELAPLLASESTGDEPPTLSERPSPRF